MNPLSLRAALLPCLTLAVAGGVAAQKTPTIDQSMEMHSVNAPSISPDGARVVYEQTRTDWDANAFETDLWLADVAGATSHLLTTTGHSSNNAGWSPDGKWIAFLSDRSGYAAQVSSGQAAGGWVMPGNGGEAQQLTKLEAGVNGFDWAPDSKSLAVAAENAESKAMKDRKESFGDYEVIHADYKMVHLWLVTLPAVDDAGNAAATADPKLLTKEDMIQRRRLFVLARWQEDRLQCCARPRSDLGLLRRHLHRHRPRWHGEEDRRHARTGLESAAWSPLDGKQIAYVTAGGAKYFFYTNAKIAVVDSDGGAPHILTDAFDENADLLRWAPEGIYFSALQKTASALFLLNPTSKSIKPIAIPGSIGCVRLHLLQRFPRASPMRGAGANQFSEIYTAALPKGSAVPLTHAAKQLDGFTTAKREVVRWKSGDGTEIEGVLYKPADFSPTKKYPLLVVIHGGPTGVDMPSISPDRYYPIERFVARGALILRPNYRGSAGYGEKFRSLNVRNLGVGDYADVISGVDYLITQGFVDKDRVGSMGWSEGGYISAFITTSSDRFKAVSVGAGISDWMTYYANTDITPFTPQYLHATPWDDPEIYKVTSPISYVAKAKTPTLIRHGGSDHRVPVANSYELRQALEDHGVPVKMVIYDGFGHPITKPKQQRAVMEENENWFAHYIWGDPLAPALTPEVKAKIRRQGREGRQPEK